ncbi:MAG: ATP-binding protein [Lachnospiraceae bacterium]|nr:ATP-binding protein [Lachnospiraceae bacterium]
MGRTARKFPIGVQDFEGLREDGFLYVDKTEYICHLLNGKAYFLSRPRRFGKSLLISTLKAFFKGKRELFKGLQIEELLKDDPEAFQEYPVFHFDFNIADYSVSDRRLTESGTRRMLPVEEVLDAHLRKWEKIYGYDPSNKTLALRFDYLLKSAREKTGKRAVVLVDEYDKPLLESDSVTDEANQNAFKGFFGVLKSDDEYLKFVFITGVTKFSKVSIFSDLNQLQDISLDGRYSGICGITEKEMKESFMPEIRAMAEKQGMEETECLEKLAQMYDGYHFCHDTAGIYNPYSLLNALSSGEFDSKWFESGTPGFLIKKLKETDFDPKIITDGQLHTPRDVLSEYRTDDVNPVPLFYQTGYITIKGYDREFRSYELGYPNDEVKYGFLNCLAPMLLRDEKARDPLDVRSFVMDIKNGDTDSLRDRLTALFARIPYPNDGNDKYIERDFQNVIYITFMLLGQFVHTELHSAKGRADAVVETKDLILLFEFKRDRSAEEALKQIDEKGYDKPYAADSHRIIKVGVNFDSEKRELEGWKVKDACQQ